MQKLATQFLLFTFFHVFIVHTLSIASTEVDDTFSYEINNEKGPARWGELREDWRACSKGSKQSPIDLKSHRAAGDSHTKRLNTKYKPSNATLENKGHDIMLQWEDDAGSIEINGVEYNLIQCHWHTPSEHTINGQRFALELHMVHESTDGKKNKAVIGILYTVGSPDPFLSTLTQHIRSIAQKGEKTSVEMVNPNDIKRGSIRDYYRYMGSLTTPPCNENVVWTIGGKVRTVSIEQVNLLRGAIHENSGRNARPIQQTNGRPMNLYASEEDNDDDEENDD